MAPLSLPCILSSAVVVFCHGLVAADVKPFTAVEIMRRVAENQDRLQAERTSFVYDQKIRVVSRKKDAKIQCEQETDYVISPEANRSERKWIATRGRYRVKNELVSFHQDPENDKATLDSGIVESFRDDLTKDNTRDGLAKDLFPLTTEGQSSLDFELTGTRTIQGRPAFLVTFRPKDRKDIGWAGEAAIDQAEFQPITVYTKLSRRLPFDVRTLLGTDVPGLGFSTRYTRVGEGVWFPATFGTEFRVNAVYLFHRTISVDLQNTNLRRTAVDSNVVFDHVP